MPTELKERPKQVYKKSNDKVIEYEPLGGIAHELEREPNWWEKIIFAIKHFFERLGSFLFGERVYEPEPEEKPITPFRNGVPEKSREEIEKEELEREHTIADLQAENLDIVSVFRRSLEEKGIEEKDVNPLDIFELYARGVKAGAIVQSRKTFIKAIEYATGLSVEDDWTKDGNIALCGQGRDGDLAVIIIPPQGGRNNIKTPNNINDTLSITTNDSIKDVTKVNLAKEFADFVEENPEFIELGLSKKLTVKVLDETLANIRSHKPEEKTEEVKDLKTPDIAEQEQNPDEQINSDTYSSLVADEDTVTEEIADNKVPEQIAEVSKDTDVAELEEVIPVPSAEISELDKLAENLKKIDARVTDVTMPEFADEKSVFGVKFELEDESQFKLYFDKQGNVRDQSEFVPTVRDNNELSDIYMVEQQTKEIPSCLTKTVEDFKPVIKESEYINKNLENYKEREEEKMPVIEKNTVKDFEYTRISEAKNENEFRNEISEIIHNPNFNDISLKNGVVTVKLSERNPIVEGQIPELGSSDMIMSQYMVIDPKMPDKFTVQTEISDFNNLGGAFRTVENIFDISSVSNKDYAYAVQFVSKNENVISSISPREDITDKKQESKFPEADELFEEDYEVSHSKRNAEKIKTHARDIARKEKEDANGKTTFETIEKSDNEEEIEL